MVLVDDLDERLDLAAAVDKLLTHAAGNLGGVALDTGNNGVGEGVSLGASVLRLDDDDLYRESQKGFEYFGVSRSADRIVAFHLFHRSIASS